MSEEIVKIDKLDLQPLDEQTEDIAHQILEEQNVDKIKDLTTLFNLNSQKRNVVRIMKMNKLLDNVTDEIVTRFENKPGNFSNEDLIKYMQVTESSIDKATKNLNLVEEAPPIHYQQNNQVNINIVDTLDRDSKDRVLEYVNSILKGDIKTSEPIIEIKEEEVHTDE